GEEHVLGAAEPDALGAELAGLFRIHRLVGIRAHAEAAMAIRDLHEAPEVAGQSRVLELGHAEGDDAARAVDRDTFAFLHRLAAGRQLAARRVDAQIARAHHAHASHAARDHGRV